MLPDLLATPPSTILKSPLKQLSDRITVSILIGLGMSCHNSVSAPLAFRYGVCRNALRIREIRECLP
jgi:hypothetical protein